MNNLNYAKFDQLHKSQEPLILYNCWNVSTARIIEKSGGSAIATSSYAMADSLGYDDGENLPFPIFLQIISKIVQNTTLPVSVDIETGYGNDILRNVLRLLELGIVGINLEDRIIGAKEYTLLDVTKQCDKISMIIESAKNNNYNIFINARTDVFFMEPKHTIATVDLALERCEAYKKAGAKSIFVPGLKNKDLIEYFVMKSPLPVNIMLSDTSINISDMANMGVKRISYGPLSYFNAVINFEKRAREVYQS